MKKEFQLETVNDLSVPAKIIVSETAKIKIIGREPNYKPYVVIEIYGQQNHFIQDKDCERFARNILKALGKEK